MDAGRFRQYGQDRRHAVRHACALTLAISVGVGAARPAAAQRLQFRQLTPDDGLSSAWVSVIYQDRTGFVWFGTNKGLDRYDGYSVAAYRHRQDDSASLGDSFINFIAEDRDSVLWIGTKAGVSRYDRARDAFVNYPVASKGTTLWATSMLHDRRGVTWLGTNGGLYRFDRRTGAATPFAGRDSTAVRGISIVGIREDAQGHIWMATGGAGLKELDPAAGTVRTFNHASTGSLLIPDDDIKSIDIDSSGTLWVGTYHGGLVRVDTRSHTGKLFVHRADDPRSLGLNAVQRVAAGRHGIWVGMENGGLDLLDPATGTFQHNVADPNDLTGLNNNSVWALCEDAAGAIWVGTFAGGVNVSKQNSGGIRRYRSMPGDPSSLSGNSVLGFAEDHRGTIWVATDGGGLDAFDRTTGRFTRLTTHNSNLTSDAVLAAAEDADGNLWIGTWAGGVLRLNPERTQFTAYTRAKKTAAEDNIFAVHVDRAGRLFAGSLSAGLFIYDRAHDRFTSTTVGPANSNSQVRLIGEANDGRILVGTDGSGLMLYDPVTQKKQWFSHDAKRHGSLADNSIRSLLETVPGTLWVGTANGLDRVDLAKGTIAHFTEADGLPSNFIAGLATDASGALWISTDKGVVRFDPATKQLKTYSAADGLQGSEFNGGAYYRTRDGAILFGGGRGFNVIRPDQLVQNAHKPPVVLTGFQLFTKPVAIGAAGSPLKQSVTVTNRLVLEHGQSVFTFEFAALDYAAPEQNQYAYRLDGFDTGWNSVGHTRTATYTNLAPGTYVFRVKASNNDGVWNDTGTAVTVVVAPAIWQTWWFRLLVVLVIGETVRRIVRRERTRRRDLEAMNTKLAQAAEHDRASQQYLAGNVAEMLGAMQRFSNGDLSVSVDVRTDDDIGQLRRGFNTAIANIHGMVRQVQDVLDATVRASRQIQESSEALGDSAEEQIGQATQVATAAEQITATVSENARHIAIVADMAERSGRDAAEGGRVVRDTFVSMESIVSVVGVAAQKVTGLGESSAQISAITRVIEQIADQTDLLALNAAIEAARAGRHGRTFMIVAKELRQLADRTSKEIREIGRVINRNQHIVSDAAATMTQVSGHVASGKALVDQAGAALESIITNSERVLASVKQVTESSEEQAATTLHIGENVDAISRVTRAAAEGNQTIAAAIEELNALIENLQSQMARFQLGAGGEPGTSRARVA